MIEYVAKETSVDMKIYMAPMEGLTGYIFRREFEKHFGKGMVDKYFIPFISPNQSNGYTTREVNDIKPEHNIGMCAIPQIMANNADYFIKAAIMLGDLGYKEINLNLGCPSGTVVSKFRGAGFLAKPQELDVFLDKIFNDTRMSGLEISIKTRLGMKEPGEFKELLNIYNRYPLKELIIHPRVREDYYKNHPNMDLFKYALDVSKAPVGYNGDIVSIDDYNTLLKGGSQDIDSVMIGRGFVGNPPLIEQIRDYIQTDNRVVAKRIKGFVNDVFAGYLDSMPDAKNAMHKMKEMWVYIPASFDGGEKAVKEIRKAKSVSEYKAAVDMFFSVTKYRY